MSSRFKKAHRTHALAQRAGERYPHLPAGHADRRAGGDGDALALFAELSSRVPDPTERARLLGVSETMLATWERGLALPVLQARRKAIERALRAADSGPR